MRYVVLKECSYSNPTHGGKAFRKGDTFTDADIPAEVLADCLKHWLAGEKPAVRAVPEPPAGGG